MMSGTKFSSLEQLLQDDQTKHKHYKLDIYKAYDYQTKPTLRYF